MAKIFEVGDVLPEQIKVSCPANLTMGDFDVGSSYPSVVNTPSLYIYTDSGSYQLIDYDIDDDAYAEEGSVICYFQNNSTQYIYDAYDAADIGATDFYLNCDTPSYIEIDLSGLSIAQRTVSSVDAPFTLFTWEEIPQGYNVTYEENGGTNVTDLTEQTNLPSPIPIPTKENHSFLGWYYDSGFTNEAVADDPLTTDVTLYAKWELNIYTITYNSNGGSSVSQATGVTALPSTLPTTTKAGYTFVAWYIDSALTTRAVAGATIEEDTTLYAKWHTLGSLFTEIADTIRSKDGTSENIRDVDFGERVNTLPSPKEEETKTVTPNFASGNVVVTPTTGKVMTQVTINKDANLIADNIKKDVTVHGITGNSFVTIELTQAQYNALTTKDSNTYYLIVEE